MDLDTLYVLQGHHHVERLVSYHVYPYQTKARSLASHVVHRLLDPVSPLTSSAPLLYPSPQRIASDTLGHGPGCYTAITSILTGITHRHGDKPSSSLHPYMIIASIPCFVWHHPFTLAHIIRKHPRLQHDTARNIQAACNTPSLRIIGAHLQAAWWTAIDAVATLENAHSGPITSISCDRQQRAESVGSVTRAGHGVMQTTAIVDSTPQREPRIASPKPSRPMGNSFLFPSPYPAIHGTGLITDSNPVGGIDPLSDLITDVSTELAAYNGAQQAALCEDLQAHVNSLSSPQLPPSQPRSARPSPSSPQAVMPGIRGSMFRTIAIPRLNLRQVDSLTRPPHHHLGDIFKASNHPSVVAVASLRPASKGEMADSIPAIVIMDLQHNGASVEQDIRTGMMDLAGMTGKKRLKAFDSRSQISTSKSASDLEAHFLQSMSSQQIPIRPLCLTVDQSCQCSLLADMHPPAFLEENDLAHVFKKHFTDPTYASPSRGFMICDVGSHSAWTSPPDGRTVLIHQLSGSAEYYIMKSPELDLLCLGMSRMSIPPTPFTVDASRVTKISLEKGQALLLPGGSIYCVHHLNLVISCFWTALSTHNIVEQIQAHTVSRDLQPIDSRRERDGTLWLHWLLALSQREQLRTVSSSRSHTLSYDSADLAYLIDHLQSMAKDIAIESRLYLGSGSSNAKPLSRENGQQSKPDPGQSLGPREVSTEDVLDICVAFKQEIRGLDAGH